MYQLYEWQKRARRGALVVGGGNRLALATEGRPVVARSARTVSLVELPAIATGMWAAEVSSRAGAVRLRPAVDPRWAAALITELNRC